MSCPKVLTIARFSFFAIRLFDAAQTAAISVSARSVHLKLLTSLSSIGRGLCFVRFMVAQSSRPIALNGF